MFNEPLSAESVSAMKVVCCSAFESMYMTVVLEYVLWPWSITCRGGGSSCEGVVHHMLRGGPSHVGGWVIM